MAPEFEAYPVGQSLGVDKAYVGQYFPASHVRHVTVPSGEYVP